MKKILLITLLFVVSYGLADWGTYRSYDKGPNSRLRESELVDGRGVEYEDVEYPMGNGGNEYAATNPSRY